MVFLFILAISLPNIKNLAVQGFLYDLLCSVVHRCKNS
ncbi:MAG: hypothetical protein HPY66_2509 [Firmicutes bacterium]|nr:hypothetical protein [Bacillota bacterium]